MDSVTEAIRRTQEAIERDGVNMSGLCERLEERANSYEQSGPSAHHTAALLREAKFEIECLQDAKRAALKLANEHAMKVNELRQQLEKAKRALAVIDINSQCDIAAKIAQACLDELTDDQGK